MSPEDAAKKFISTLERDPRPYKAMEAASRKISEIRPYLEDYFLEACDRYSKTGEIPSTDAHVYVLYILSECGSDRAAKALKMLFTERGTAAEASIVFLDDAIDSCPVCLLGSVARNSPEELFGIAVSGVADDEVRNDAIVSFGSLYLWNFLTRSEVVGYLRRITNELMKENKPEVILFDTLVNVMIDIHPGDFRPEISAIERAGDITNLFGISKLAEKKEKLSLARVLEESRAEDMYSIVHDSWALLKTVDEWYEDIERELNGINIDIGKIEPERPNPKRKSAKNNKN
jgi:hypothetical protein